MDSYEVKTVTGQRGWAGFFSETRMDYDLDIILMAHFAERTRGGSPPGVGQFAQELFDVYNDLIEARIPGLDSRRRSIIAGLAFFATGLTPDQNADMAVAEFTAVNS